VDVDEARVAPRLVAPHADEKIVPRKDPARRARERAQELELRRRQRELPVARDRLHAREIDDESPEAELAILGVIGVNAIAAKQRLDPRGKLIVVERLAKVVVGADPQSHDTVGRVILRRKEEHGDV